MNEEARPEEVTRMIKDQYTRSEFEFEQPSLCKEPHLVKSSWLPLAFSSAKREIVYWKRTFIRERRLLQISPSRGGVENR